MRTLDSLKAGGLLDTDGRRGLADLPTVRRALVERPDLRALPLAERKRLLERPILTSTSTLIRVHGSGAAALICSWRRAGWNVAIKVVHPDLAASLGPERFRREIKLIYRRG